MMGMTSRAPAPEQKGAEFVTALLTITADPAKTQERLEELRAAAALPAVPARKTPLALAATAREALQELREQQAEIERQRAELEALRADVEPKIARLESLRAELAMLDAA